MIVRKLRLERGWTQEQLAEMSGLNVRTIQRIERGHKAGLESLKSLAAVFEIDVSTLMEENNMAGEKLITTEEKEAIEYVRDIKSFYVAIAIYIVVIPILCSINITQTPDTLWVIWPALAWGLGIALYGLVIHEKIHFFSPEWERKKIEHRMKRKGQR